MMCADHNKGNGKEGKGDKGNGGNDMDGRDKGKGGRAAGLGSRCDVQLPMLGPMLGMNRI